MANRVIPPHRRDPDDSHDSQYYRRGVDDIRNVITSTTEPLVAEPGTLWYNPEGVPEYGVDIGISKDDADELYTSKDEFAAVADVPHRVEALEAGIPGMVADAIAADATVRDAAAAAVTTEIAGRSLLEGPRQVPPVLILSPDGSASQDGPVDPTIVGSVTTTPGTYGTAWNYTGTGQRVEIANSGYLQRDEGTVFARVMFPTELTEDAQTQTVLSGPSDGFRVVMIRRYTSSKPNHIRFQAGSTLGTVESDAESAPSNTLLTLAVTWKNGIMRCFINGEFIGSNTFTPGTSDSSLIYTTLSGGVYPRQSESYLLFPVNLADTEIARISGIESSHTINTVSSEGVATIPAAVTKFVAPGGSGATLLELRASNNTATTIGVTPDKALLVDGKTVGGPVGADQIEDAAVTPSKTSFVSPGKNLYNPENDTLDRYVADTNGQEISFAGYRTSEYIPVKAGQPYTVTQARKLVLYDTNKAFVSGQNLSQAGGPQTVTPTVDGYARFSNDTNHSYYTPFIQFEASATATAYEPYGYVMPDLQLTDAQKPSIPTVLTVTKSGETYAIENVLGTAGKLVITTSRTGSSNGAFTFTSTTLEGTPIHTTTDDITPIRTFATVGANHGYTTISSYEVAGHGKTTADLGSVYTDGTRQYTLLRIDGDTLVFGHPYTVTDGVTSGVTTAPAATLTHVSGGMNTTSVPITTAGTVTQLYPSIRDVSVRYVLDGRELTTNGTYNGNTLRVLESYEIMDYKALIDWARANVGQSFANAPIDGVVRIANTYTFTGQGRCTVSSSLTALKKVALGRTGFLQSVALARSGYTLRRYMPGVKTKSGIDFSTPVDMTSYSTSLLFGPADYVDPAKPPSRYVDWLQSGPTKLVGFTMGYVSDKTNSKDSDRMDQPYAWDMRSTKKSYPVALEGVTLNAGEVRSIEGFRNYVAPHPSGATLVNVVEDAQAAYVHLDFHTSVTAQAIPLPDHIGKSVTVLDSDGLTVANDTVDASGLTVTVPGTAGRAVVKLT